ncbi:MAG: METTL5 family protein [Ignisphaera sp.]|uniref:Methyltransferase domain-containing protein n=1 Tax=Ignisphaera aggregans TaxID=334771 RepID=A0A7C4NJW4_9CREN
MVISKKELEILLSRVPNFKHHNILLEQYVCDSSIASELLWLAYMHNDIENKVVADLGCGTGALSYGALIMGAKDVLCIDVDLNALKIANNFLFENRDRFDTINADIENLHLIGVQTVVMNPPFGVHRRGIDIVFLKRALDIKPKAVYTIHKYNPESHKIIQEIVLGYGYRVIDMAIRDMRIPAIYHTHRKRVHRFQVALYAISKR